MLDDILKSRGTPNWVDCACLDLETAEAFYKAVFGWASERSVAADGSVYALRYLKGKRVAGLFELPSELIDRAYLRIGGPISKFAIWMLRWIKS